MTKKSCYFCDEPIEMKDVLTRIPAGWVSGKVEHFHFFCAIEALAGDNCEEFDVIVSRLFSILTDILMFWKSSPDWAIAKKLRFIDESVKSLKRIVRADSPKLSGKK